MGRLNIRIKVSFEGIADGWTSEHFASFNNFKFKDSAKLSKIGVDSDNPNSVTEENLQGVLDVVKSKFIAGKVWLNDEQQTSDMQAEDIEDLPISTVGEIMQKLTGGGLEKKSSDS